MRDSPRFLGNPCACVPRSLTPVGRAALAIRERPNVAFQVSDPVGHHETRTFEAPSRSPHARCLRFTAWVAPPPRKTRSQLVGYTFTEQDLHLLGSTLVFQGGITASFPNEPDFAWRTRKLRFGHSLVDPNGAVGRISL
jgi:hypothetical protein